MNMNMKMNSSRMNMTGQKLLAGLATTLLCSALTLLLSTGCRADNPASAAANAAGVYPLVSVNGNAVPCEVKHGETAMTIKSGAFTLNADGTCHSRMDLSAPARGEVSREVKATYTRQGNDLTMKWERAGTTKGQLAGDAFTMVNEGMTFVYRK